MRYIPRFQAGVEAVQITPELDELLAFVPLDIWESIDIELSDDGEFNHIEFEGEYGYEGDYFVRDDNDNYAIWDSYDFENEFKPAN